MLKIWRVPRKLSFLIPKVMKMRIFELKKFCRLKDFLFNVRL